MFKIGIHALDKLSGGPANFFQKLKLAIEENEYASIVGAGSFFQDIGLYSSVAKRFTLHPYVLRIDGIYFDKKNTTGDNYKLNKRIFKSIDSASGVIFQSNFSKNLVEYHYGKIHVPSTVILNGAPLMNLKKLIECKKKTIVCSADWRSHKRLLSIIEVVHRLRKNIDCELIVLGDTRGNKIPHYNFVRFIGSVPQDIVLTYLMQADLFIHLAWLDPCPNSVVEAISCGVPVVCSNRGGTPEIVNFTSGGRVASCDNEVDYRDLVDLYNPPVPDIDQVVKCAEYVLTRQREVTSKIDRSKIDIVITAKKYVNFLKSVVES
jgi:glycosyltransferase involved in cell wall biosynthesis